MIGFGLRRETIEYRDALPVDSLLLDENAKADLRNRIASDEALRKSIEAEVSSIQMQQAHWKEYADNNYVGEGRMLLSDYLVRHPELVHKNRDIEKKVWDRRWPEKVRLSTPEEKLFLKSVAEVGGEHYVEVLKVSRFHERGFAEAAFAVGPGDSISAESVDEMLGRVHLKGEKGATLFLVHNHFDPYGEVRGLHEHFENNNGLVTVGGLSKADIELADDILAKRMGGVGKVVMVAISERGLTYTYEAGISQFRDWENEVKK